MVRSLIVGFDPGTTAGLAIISVDGEVLDLLSKKNLTKKQIIRRVLNFGRPILIATDRRFAPKAVKSLASSFELRVFRPTKDLDFKEKAKLIKIFGVKPESSHQIDALAAAAKAWKCYRNKFHKIKATLKRVEREKDYDDVLFMLFKDCTNVALALERSRTDKWRK